MWVDGAVVVVNFRGGFEVVEDGRRQRLSRVVGTAQGLELFA